MKVDLHLHSKFSNHPSEWFLKKIGASESYTEPEYIYETAIKRGMTFVTITDHNKIDGALYLTKKYPDKCFISVEATAYFPEDGCKVHILIYNITEEQFKEIDILRKNIYKLRDYIKANNLAYSVAHATYSVNGTLKSENVEKLILLFDIFEIINGGRGEKSNKNFENFLKSLTQEDLNKLYQKHKIDTFSPTPWIKGFTGGSDDHAGLFIGKTYTYCEDNGYGSIDYFIDSLKKKKTTAHGRYNDYQGFTFAIYKIAYDFTKQNKSISESFLNDINQYLFEEKKYGFKDWFKIKRLKKNKKDKKIKALIGEFLEEIRYETDIEKKLNIFYDKISLITNEFILLVVKALKKDLKKGKFYNFFRDISTAITGIFLCSPFLSSLNIMFENNNILDSIIKELDKKELFENKRVLWFTDTIGDLNGVSITLKKIAEKSLEYNKNLAIVCSLTDKSKLKDLPMNVINIDYLEKFDLPYYEDYQLKVLPILDVLKKIYDYQPEEIYISTPGTVGLIGLLFGKILNLKTTGIYHTDFSMQAKEISENDASLINMTESYTKWFFEKLDIIKVPTNEYISLLEKRGFDKSKLKIFTRAIDTNLFYYKKREKQESIRFLYAGRVSQDKNLDFLIDVFNKIEKENCELNIVGDGPYLNELKEKNKSNKKIKFLGKVEYNELPDIYNNSDIFLFPSITDTFGMVVLEAQSCGLPAIVSDIGGPKEIIIDGETGFIAKANDINSWIEKINQLINIYYTDNYEKMCIASKELVLNKFSWDRVMRDIFN
jgi:glycosyltransferase involved in cell wall biosynthesis